MTNFIKFLAAIVFVLGSSAQASSCSSFLVTPAERQLRHLGLESDFATKLSGKVLIVGDGFSELGPYLLSRGHNVDSLDPVYEQGALDAASESVQAASQAYHAAMGGRARPGSLAEMLSLPTNAYDAVIAHMVLNNVKGADLDTALYQIREALHVGGTAYIVAPGKEEDSLKNMLAEFVRAGVIGDLRQAEVGSILREATGRVGTIYRYEFVRTAMKFGLMEFMLSFLSRNA